MNKNFINFIIINFSSVLNLASIFAKKNNINNVKFVNADIFDDVFTENLDFYLKDQAFDKQKDIVMINSKGFGGNNATASGILSMICS